MKTETPAAEPVLRLYAVRNKDGQYFRSKGYGGGGLTWVDSIDKARIYPKAKTARGRVTFFARHYPQYGVPVLVELQVTQLVDIDETKRFNKVQRAKDIQDAKYVKRRAEYDLRIARNAAACAAEALRLAEAEAEKVNGQV